MKASLQEAIEQLKLAHVKITPQRVAMLDYLSKASHHPSADDIYQELAPDYPKLSLATIYNNLRLFSSLGLVQEMTYGDDATRYDFTTEPHYHVVCRSCGAVRDLHLPLIQGLEEMAAQQTDFMIEGHRLEIFGLCPDCQ